MKAAGGAHDLVDELRLVVFPVVLGAGERLLGETSDKKPLSLVSARIIGDGLQANTRMSTHTWWTGASLPGCRLSAQAQHGKEGFVDPPHLFVSQVPGQFSEESGVHGPYSLHKYPSGLSSDLGFRAERRGSGACRSGSHEDDRPREELVGLDDDAVTVTVLFMPDAAG